MERPSHRTAWLHRIGTTLRSSRHLGVGVAIGMTLEMLSTGDERLPAAELLRYETIILGTAVVATAGLYRAQGVRPADSLNKGATYAAGIVTGQLAGYVMRTALLEPALQQLSRYLG